MVQSKVRAQGVSHAVLETCFITDRDDVDWYLVNKSKIADAIIQGIIKGFKLNVPQLVNGASLSLEQDGLVLITQDDKIKMFGNIFV